MTVTFTPDGGSPVTLAGADTASQFDAVQGMKISAEDVTQQAAIIRASRPRRYDRGNRTYTVTFAVTRSHASYAASLAHVVAHAQLFTVLGDTVISDGVTTLTLEQCRVAATGGSNGVLSEWSYNITGTLAT